MKMTRQFRRKLMRDGAKEADIVSWERAMIKDTIDNTIDIYQHVVMLCLKDQLGFGKVRIKRLIDKINETFDCISEGVVSIEDIKETITKELGIEIIDKE